jgi:hypothetical protein
MGEDYPQITQIAQNRRQKPKGRRQKADQTWNPNFKINNRGKDKDSVCVNPRLSAADPVAR